MAIIKPNNNTISAITALPAAIKTGGLVHISTTNISSGDASVELTFDSDYDNYRIICSNLVPNTSGGGTSISVILKRSGQGSYDTSANNYRNNGYDMSSHSNTMNGQGNENLSAGQLVGWNMNNTQYNTSYNIIEIGGVHETTYHLFDCFSQQLQRGSDTDDAAMVHYHFAHTQAAALTNIKILPASGNFKSGKILFYGYKE
ncbi:hypothetical protein HTVC035P_gp39 [Pelagibacter phage HTVC035P]|nr:hypothetical protein HTVC035P_gp39 [Pelagibacter phage HTVC035P]